MVRTEVKQFLQHLPSFFEILWRHRDVVFCATPWTTIRPMLTDVQQLIQFYSNLFMHTNRYVNKLEFEECIGYRRALLLPLGLQCCRSHLSLALWLILAFIAGTTVTMPKGEITVCLLTYRQFCRWL